MKLLKDFAQASLNQQSFTQKLCSKVYRTLALKILFFRLSTYFKDLKLAQAESLRIMLEAQYFLQFTIFKYLS